MPVGDDLSEAARASVQAVKDAGDAIHAQIDALGQGAGEKGAAAKRKLDEVVIWFHNHVTGP
jgi:hypothetical protein